MLEQLDLLVLLMESPDHWWDAASVARTLGLSANAARVALERFASQNLLAISLTTDVRYQFRPGEPGLADIAQAFGETCRTSRRAVLQTIAGRPARSIRDFADAFRIRRNDDR